MVVNTLKESQQPMLVAGLQNPVSDAQVIFRSALKAMSEPGTLVDIAQPNGVANLTPAMFGLILALIDQQTTLWLSDSFNQPSIVKNIQFHAGAMLTTDAAGAQFALAQGDQITDLARFNQGSDESPEMSCSLLLQVSHLSALDAAHSDQPINQQLVLTGPGIQSSQTIAIGELSSELLDYLVNRDTAFPKGLDCYFVSGDQLLCIPRTTQIKVV